MSELVDETMEEKSLKDSKNELFKNHRLFSIFNGNPQSITLSAALLKDMRLVELYKLLNAI